MEAAALTKNAPGQDFQVIFQNYYPKVVRQIAGFTGLNSVAEDLAQEVFLRLYHLDWTQIANLNAWLTRSSLNAACNYLRGEKRRTTREESNPDMNNCNTETSEQLLIREETRHHIMNILYALEERERHLLLLKYQGYSYQEIAKILNLKPVSVGTLLARARRQFKLLYLQKEE
ncbi:MAG: sigma-70 family RNA polymerase sigma factor [Peptococcaceae bacterium]|nr:sigma-70 family RNA polymerase sigma factor [Peptococcaceae bacterium]